MLSQSAVSYQQINMFINDKVQARRLEIQKTILLIGEVIQEVLKNVEQLVTKKNPLSKFKIFPIPHSRSHDSFQHLRKKVMANMMGF